VKTNQKNIERYPKRRGRKIVVNGVAWKWSYNSFGSVLAYSELGKRLCDSVHIVANTSPDIFARGQWKRTSDGVLSPKDVARWISDMH